MGGAAPLEEAPSRLFLLLLVFIRCGLFLSCPLGPRLRPLYLSFLRRSIALHRASEPAHKQPTIRQEVLRRVMRLPTTLHKVASRPLSSSSPPAQLVKKTHKTHPKNPQDQMKPTKPTTLGFARVFCRT